MWPIPTVSVSKKNQPYWIMYVRSKMSIFIDRFSSTYSYTFLYETTNDPEDRWYSMKDFLPNYRVTNCQPNSTWELIPRVLYFFLPTIKHYRNCLPMVVECDYEKQFFFLLESTIDEIFLKGKMLKKRGSFRVR